MGESTASAVSSALGLGYRHVDTAQARLAVCAQGVATASPLAAGQAGLQVAGVFGNGQFSPSPSTSSPRPRCTGTSMTWGPPWRSGRPAAAKRRAAAVALTSARCPAQRREPPRRPRCSAGVDHIEALAGRLGLRQGLQGDP